MGHFQILSDSKNDNLAHDSTYFFEVFSPGGIQWLKASPKNDLMELSPEKIREVQPFGQPDVKF